MTLEVRKGQNGAGQNGVAAIKTELATAVSPHHLQFEGCPHFALSNDPDTRILFPSPAGTCFHVQESAAVNLDHQQTYCLHDNHTACPIFQQAHPAVLPADIRLHAIPNTNAHLLKIILTIIVVLAIVGLGAYAFLGGFNGNNGTTTADNSGNSAVAAVALPDATETAEPTATQTPAPTNTPTETATPAPTETAEPTATQTPPPTATAEPTATATPQPTNTPAPTATAVPLPQAIINVSRLNIRSGPGTAYPIVALADSGAQFDITGQLTDGSWWQICCVNGDEIGWVFGESVIINDDTAVVPFVAPPPLPTATPSP